MTARIVEFVARPGKAEELGAMMEQEILPMVRALPGFMGKWTLAEHLEPRRIVVVSFWRTQAEASAYEKKLYPKVQRMLAPLVDSEQRVRAMHVVNGEFTGQAAMEAKKAG